MKSWKNACPSDLKLYDGICKVFSKHDYLLEGFFEKNQVRLSSTPEVMIERTSGCSHGEIVLVKVALDMWSGSGNVFVWQILETLDHQNFLNVIEGLVLIKREQQTLIGPLGGFS